MKQGRRFLSLVLALVMVFSIAPITVFASGDPLDDIEITTTDKTYYYGLDTYLKYDEDEEEYYCRFYTNLNDDFSVALPGEEEENTTDFWYQDVFYTLTLNEDLSDIQSYDNQWVAGNIYTLVYDLYYRDEDYEYIKTSKSYEINYTILDNPISSISVDDIYVYDGLGDKRESYHDWDADKDIYYYIRNYEPEWNDVTIYFKNGDVIEDDCFYFNDRYYSLNYGCKDKQTKDDTWEVGSTNSATATLGTISTTYNVEVRENPVASISAYNKTLIENYDSEIRSEWVDDDEVEFPYYNYNYDDGDMGTIVTFKNGNVQVGNNIIYDNRYYSMNYYCDDEQTYSNQWKAGTTHTAYAKLGNISTSYTVEIKENPIESFAFTKDAVTLYSGGGDVSYPDLEFVVTPKVGDPITCNGYYEVYGREFRPVLVSDPQDDGELEVGETYTVEYEMLGKTDSIDYTIESSNYSFYESWDGSGVVITGINLTKETEVIELPNEINGKPVVRFCLENYNKYYDSVKKLVLSSSIESINYWDANSFTNLEEIVLGTKTKDIYFDSFYRNDLVITIPETSEYFYSDSTAIFNADKTEIEYIINKTGTYTVPDTVKDISILAERTYDELTVMVNSTNPYFVKVDGVIYNKDKTKVILCDTSKSGSYEMPSTVTEIAEYAFAGCNNLSNVSISPNVTELVYNEFNDCTGLTSVSLPSSLTSIGESSFEGCASLASIELPESLISIGNASFFNTGLTSIEFPNSLQKIGSNSFAATKLTSVYIPNNLQDIGGYAFAFTNINSATFGDEISTLAYGMFAYTKFTSFTNPSNITHIGSDCFWGCDKLKSVKISNATIGSGAFGGCYALTSVKLPDDISSIEDNTFCSCESLKSIVIPDSVQYIGEGAFRYSGITALNIPQTVVKIAYKCFKDAKSLANIQLPSSAVEIGGQAFHNTAWYNSQPTTGVIYLGNVLYGTKSDNIGTKLTVKSGTKVIADYAFANHTEIKTLSLPEGLEIVGDKAFLCCTSLTKVELPSTLYDLGDWYDDWDEDTDEIYISGSSAFSGCNGITYSIAEGNKAIALNSYGYPSPLARYESQRITIKAPTSTETGLAAKINTNGDKTDYVSPITLPIICNHTIVVGATAKAATCTTTGNSKYWTCSKCGKYFGDAEGTKEIVKDSWIIPAKGHSYDSSTHLCKLCGKVNPSYTGLLKNSSGSYIYYEKGTKSTTTGLVKMSSTSATYAGKYVYLTSGKLDTTKSGLYKNSSGTWLYISKGIYNTSYKGLAKKSSDSTYWYVDSGKIVTTNTGLYKIPSTSAAYASKYVYLTSGKLDTTKTGLYMNSSGTWLYISKGIYNTSYKGLAKKSSDSTYWYVESGKIVTTKTGLYNMPSTSTYQASKTIYLKSGKFMNTYTGLTKDGTKYKYVSKGIVSTTTGLVKMPSGSPQAGKTIYLNKGVFQSSYTGLVKIGSKYKYVVKGIFTTKTGSVKMPSGSTYYASKTVKLKSGIKV